MRIVLFLKSVIESQSLFQLSLVELILPKKRLLLILLMKILIWKLFKIFYKKISFSLLKSTVEKHQFVKFLFNNDVSVVFSTLNIFSDFKWTLYTYQNQVLQSSQIMKKLPKLLMKNSNVEEFINIISLAYMCPGNEDFSLLVENKIEKGSELCSFDKEKSVRAYIQNSECCQVRHWSVIRTYKCELLILNNQRCEPCTKHRKVLLKLSDRKSGLDESFVPKNIPNEALSHKQALVKLSAIQKDGKSLIHSRENQLRKIQNVIEKDDVKVDTGCQELFMKSPMKKNALYLMKIRRNICFGKSRKSRVLIKIRNQ